MQELYVVELTNEELSSIVGGQTVAYYVGYAAGTVVSFFNGLVHGLGLA